MYIVYIYLSTAGNCFSMQNIKYIYVWEGIKCHLCNDHNAASNEMRKNTVNSIIWSLLFMI